MSAETAHAVDQPHKHVVHIDDEGSKTGMWLFLFTRRERDVRSVNRRAARIDNARDPMSNRSIADDLRSLNVDRPILLQLVTRLSDAGHCREMVEGRSSSGRKSRGQTSSIPDIGVHPPDLSIEKIWRRGTKVNDRHFLAISE